MAAGHSGAEQQSTSPAFDGFGVRLGDFVFTHKEGSTNGLTPPRVPRIGELEPWVRETPFNDGHYGGWRKEMDDIGQKVAGDAHVPDYIIPSMKRPIPGDKQLTWFGEVTEVCIVRILSQIPLKSHSNS